MRPKRRAVVAVTPTAKGMLFRRGEQFLEIKGEHCWPWFQRVEHLLNGQVNLAQARDLLAPEHYTLFVRVVDSLQRAGMVYDAAEDDPDALPGAIAARYVANIRRIEADNVQPFRTFAAVRSSRVLLAGEASYIAPLLEVLPAAGLMPEHIHVLTGVSIGDALASTSPDILLFAGSDQVDTALRTLPIAWDLRRRPVFRLALYGTTAIVAALHYAAGTGCPECLAMYYSPTTNAAAAVPSDAEMTSALRLASQLVVQQVLDYHSGTWPQPHASCVSEFNLHTAGIRHRPLSPRPDCPRCWNLTFIASNPAPTDTTLATPATGVPQLWKRAEACYVDARTGFLTEVSEGRLLQFPWHQSATRRQASSTAPHEPLWITDAGADIYEARLAVLLRALEATLHERLSGESGIVASASTLNELKGAAALQLLAQYAHTMLPGWRDLSSSAIAAEAAADLTFGYFRDRDRLSDLRVQRHERLSGHGMHVLRFAWRSRIISVTAGLDRASVWMIGLRDLWLDLTGGEHFGAAWGSAMPIRFRSGGPDATAAASVPALLTALGVDPEIRLVDSPLTRGMAPTLFAHATIGTCAVDRPAARVDQTTNVASMEPV